MTSALCRAQASSVARVPPTLLSNSKVIAKYTVSTAARTRTRSMAVANARRAEPGAARLHRPRSPPGPRGAWRQISQRSLSRETSDLPYSRRSRTSEFRIVSDTGSAATGGFASRSDRLAKSKRDASEPRRAAGEREEIPAWRFAYPVQEHVTVIVRGPAEVAPEKTTDGPYEPWEKEQYFGE